MVPELHRAQAEAFDRALVGAALDVLADAESIVEQVEDAGDHVLDQRLRAEADGDADDAGAGDQRPDLDAERGQHHQQRHDHDGCEQHVLEDRQQRAHARLSRILLAVRGRRPAPADRPSRRAMTALMMLQPKSAARMMTAALMPPRMRRLVSVVAGRHHRDVDAPRRGQGMPRPRRSAPCGCHGRSRRPAPARPAWRPSRIRRPQDVVTPLCAIDDRRRQHHRRDHEPVEQSRRRRSG